MTTTVHLTLTIEQAQAVVQACDLYTRIGLGQFEEVARLLRMGYIKPERDTSSDTFSAMGVMVDRSMRDAKEVIGHPRNGSFGIGHKRVSITAHRAFEVEKVLDQALSMHRDPNPRFRGVNYDGLSPSLRYTSDPVPVAEVKEAA
jgi:hypothetical protein